MRKKPDKDAARALKPLEQAASRNAPLSVGRPDRIGKEPMARGRFLVPKDGEIVIENLQVPGRRVDIQVGCKLDAFFQHDGRVYQFRTEVLEMDTPVRLNDSVMVKGVRIVAPTAIEPGNRRQIYRQSFAAVNPAIDVDIWAVPRSALTDVQIKLLGEIEETPDQPAETEDPGFYINRGPTETPNPRALNVVPVAVRGLCLAQLEPVLEGRPNWRGQVTDASEFGVGLTIERVVYSRLKVFQPLAVRFRIPNVTRPLEFLIEVRRVQELRDGARLGGVLLLNAASQQEFEDARILGLFAFETQRDRVRNNRAS